MENPQGETAQTLPTFHHSKSALRCSHSHPIMCGWPQHICHKGIHSWSEYWFHIPVPMCWIWPIIEYSFVGEIFGLWLIGILLFPLLRQKIVPLLLTKMVACWLWLFRRLLVLKLIALVSFFFWAAALITVEKGARVSILIEIRKHSLDCLRWLVEPNVFLGSFSTSLFVPCKLKKMYKLTLLCFHGEGKGYW